MSGCSPTSKFTSVVERNLSVVSDQLAKQRLAEFKKFLSKYLLHTDQSSGLSFLLHLIKEKPHELKDNPLLTDIETLIYLRAARLHSKGYETEETLRLLEQLQVMMEAVLAQDLSQDQIVRKAQELLLSDNVIDYLSKLTKDEKRELALLLDFFSKAAEESQDFEFASTLSIIVTALGQLA